MIRMLKLKHKNLLDIKGSGDTRLSIILSGEGVLQTSDHESSLRLLKVGTQVVRVTAAPMTRA
jgi:hypothetical protein